MEHRRAEDSHPIKSRRLVAAAAFFIGLVAFIGVAWLVRLRVGRVETSFAGSQGSATGAPMIVWVSDSLSRVSPTAPPGTSSSISLFGARGEALDAQVIVTAPRIGLTRVNIGASTLTGPGGATIPSLNISLFQEYYLSWTVSSAAPRGRGYQVYPQPPGTYPDPLVPFNDPETGAAMCGNGAPIQACNAVVPSGHSQPYWIEVSVPRGIKNSPAGNYTGTVTVSSDQGNVTVPVTLTLWNFELPLRPTFEAYAFYLNNTVGADRGYQQALFREKFFMRVNWTPADTPSDIATYGLNTVGLNFYDNPVCGSTPTQFGPAPSTAAFQANIISNGGPTAGVQYMTYNLDDHSNCTAADITAMQQWAAALHATTPPGIVSGTIGPQDIPGLQTDGTGDGLAAFDRWAMAPSDRGWEPMGNIPGKRWLLPACPGTGYSPSQELDFPPITERMLTGFLARILNAAGYEEYAMEGPQVSSPWTNPEAVNVCNAQDPGEGLFLYPRGTGGSAFGTIGVGGTEPAPSIRLKAYRDGIQDYEYTAIAQSMGLGTQAAAIYSPLASPEGVWNTSTYATPAGQQPHWDQNPADLEAARIALGNLINANSVH